MIVIRKILSFIGWVLTLIFIVFMLTTLIIHDLITSK